MSASHHNRLASPLREHAADSGERAPSTRVPLLGAFRALWLAGPLPMVVTTVDDDPTELCAAPSLWMGGRIAAHHLKAHGVSASDVLEAPVPCGTAWVQAFVGAMRAGCSFGPHGQDTGWTMNTGLDVVRRARKHRVAPSVPSLGLTTGNDETVWLPYAALHLDIPAASPCPDGCLRVGTNWNEHQVFTSQILPALSTGLELHFQPTE